MIRAIWHFFAGGLRVLAATPQTEPAMLDTVHRIETPEGVDLDLRVAGPSARFIAWLIDLLIRILVGGGISIPLAILGGFGIGIWLIIMFVLEELYPILFEVMGGGATPGKRAMGILVVHRDGTPVDWVSSVTRNLLRTADFLPMFYGFGLISMLSAHGFQRLGDLAAGTLVVYRDSANKPQTAVPNLLPHPSPAPLRLSEQRTLIGFGQRAPQLPPARAQELAALAKPLLESEPTQIRDPVNFLYGIAAWLIGRREGKSS